MIWGRRAPISKEQALVPAATEIVEPGANFGSRVLVPLIGIARQQSQVLAQSRTLVA